MENSDKFKVIGPGKIDPILYESVRKDITHSMSPDTNKLSNTTIANKLPVTKEQLASFHAMLLGTTLQQNEPKVTIIGNKPALSEEESITLSKKSLSQPTSSEKVRNRDYGRMQIESLITSKKVNWMELVGKNNDKIFNFLSYYCNNIAINDRPVTLKGMIGNFILKKEKTPREKLAEKIEELSTPLSDFLSTIDTKRL